MLQSGLKAELLVVGRLGTIETRVFPTARYASVHGKQDRKDRYVAH